MNLKDKIAVVTGVSKGIGAACVLQLLAQGVKVIGWGRNTCEQAASNDNFQFIQTDVRHLSEVKQAYEKTVSDVGIPNLIINNAGLGIFKFMQNITEQEWDLMFDTNVKGIYNCTTVLLKDFISRKSGDIINIASTAALGGIPEATAYCGSKHAVRGISLSLAQEVKKFGIRVSCVMPGSVNTEFFEQFEGVTANESMLHPNDIANQIIYLLNAPQNTLTGEVVIKPLNPSYKV